MVNCCHESCGRDDRIWLPKVGKASDDARSTGSSGRFDAALHHWCVFCGCIKNISDDRPKKMGYWINILSRIAKDCGVSQSQKRLVVKALESYEDFDDMYGTTGSSQRDVFVKVVKKYCGLCEGTIDSFVS